jgi:hypothetical protein
MLNLGHPAKSAKGQKVSNRFRKLSERRRFYRRFSARANIRAAVWDKPRSDCIVGISRFLGSSLFLLDLLSGREPALAVRNRRDYR